MADFQGNQQENLLVDFDDKFQRAIVGHMMRDKAFRLMVFAQDIQYTHFRNPYTANVAKKIQAISGDEATSGVIGPETLYQLICREYTGDSDRIKVKAEVEDCHLASHELSIEVVSLKMTGWIKLLKMKQMILKSTELINKKDFNQALSHVEGAVRQISQVDFTPENKTTVQFSGIANFLLKRDVDRFSNNCTIGSPEFDDLLLEGAMVKTNEIDSHIQKLRNDSSKKNIYPMERFTRGSLMPGDATVLLGPMNAGKTTIICTIVASNILMGKDVLLMVHEQHPDDIKIKILQSMLFMDNLALTSLAKADEKKIEWAEQLINAHLTYIHYIKAGAMNVESIGSLIEMRQDKWKSTHKGKGYDLFVDDYPGKLTARSLNHRINTKRHEEIAFIYDYFINLGREHKFHTFLAMQTNREGFKVAQGTNGEGRIVDAGDAGESFSPMQLADNVITINRADEDKIHNRIRLYVGKSRRSQTGSIFVSKTDMARSRAYGSSSSEELRPDGTTVRRSLPSFICDGKLKKDAFAQECARVFGDQTLASTVADAAKAKAALDAASPGGPNLKEVKTMDDFLKGDKV